MTWVDLGILYIGYNINIIIPYVGSSYSLYYVCAAKDRHRLGSRAL